MTIQARFRPFFNRLLGHALRTAARAIKLQRLFSPAFRRQYAVRKSMVNAHYDDFWQRVAATLGASTQQLPGGFYRISKGRASTFIRGAEVQLDDHLTLALMGNKPLVYQLLTDMQITCVPDYCTYTVTSINDALNFLETSTGSVVVKPAAGTGAGAGVTAGISSRFQLLRATVLAASFCNELLIETQFRGESYRLLFLGGTMIDAIQRCAPTIVGDGKSTISELVDKENKMRQEAAGRRSTSILAKDNEMRSHLKKQGLSLKSTPPHDQVIVLKHVINQNNASENHRVFDNVHQSFVELGETIVKNLGIDLAGIDIIAPDITKSTDSQSFIMNEVNTTPGLHHHYLIAHSAPRRDIGALILRYIFSSSSSC
jgi:D-alanine-D-alanine ligase-like ATP-grasp enzyme